MSPNFSSNDFANPPPKSVTMWKSLESFLNESTTFVLNSFDVLTVHFTPSLIKAFVIILPDVNPSQSIWVVTETDLLVLIQSIILSLKYDNDSSNDFVITLIEQPRIYISNF